MKLQTAINARQKGQYVFARCLSPPIPAPLQRCLAGLLVAPFPPPCLPTRRPEQASEGGKTRKGKVLSRVLKCHALSGVCCLAVPRPCWSGPCCAAECPVHCLKPLQRACHHQAYRVSHDSAQHYHALLSPPHTWCPRALSCKPFMYGPMTQT